MTIAELVEKAEYAAMDADNAASYVAESTMYLQYHLERGDAAAVAAIASTCKRMAAASSAKAADAVAFANTLKIILVAGAQ